MGGGGMDGLPAVEAEMLLAEARHRLLNMLQLLTGLIRLQLQAAEGEEARQHLQHLLQAVNVLGQLQQGLGAAGGATFGPYLQEAGKLWAQLAAAHRVAVSVEAPADLQLPERLATPLALILHEMVTNCLEHAFPGGRGGTIAIRLARVGDGRGEILVADDGCGLGSGELETARLGLDLIGTLTTQIGGELSMTDGAPGLHCRIRFPLPAPA